MTLLMSIILLIRQILRCPLLFSRFQNFSHNSTSPFELKNRLSLKPAQAVLVKFKARRPTIYILNLSNRIEKVMSFISFFTAKK